MKRLLVPILVSALLAGCATSSPDVVSRRDAQRMSTVVDGVVLSTRPIVIDGSQGGAGGLTGGVLGGIAGSSAGNSGSRESFAVGIIGALVGAALGNAVERQGTREQAVEYLIQLRNGERRSVIQASAGEQIVRGDSVIVVTTGGRVRVTRAAGRNARHFGAADELICSQQPGRMHRFRRGGLRPGPLQHATPDPARGLRRCGAAPGAAASASPGAPAAGQLHVIQRRPAGADAAAAAQRALSA